MLQDDEDRFHTEMCCCYVVVDSTENLDCFSDDCASVITVYLIIEHR
jgi:hypothetical protein